jgi:hypothetical protein
LNLPVDEVAKSQENNGFVKSSRQGAQKLKRAEHLESRCNDEFEALSRSERDRWTFYDAIANIFKNIQSVREGGRK